VLKLREEFTKAFPGDARTVMSMTRKVGGKEVFEGFLTGIFTRLEIEDGGVAMVQRYGCEDLFVGGLGEESNESDMLGNISEVIRSRLGLDLEKDVLPHMSIETELSNEELIWSLTRAVHKALVKKGSRRAAASNSSNLSVAEALGLLQGAVLGHTGREMVEKRGWREVVVMESVEVEGEGLSRIRCVDVHWKKGPQTRWCPSTDQRMRSGEDVDRIVSQIAETAGESRWNGERKT